MSHKKSNTSIKQSELRKIRDGKKPVTFWQKVVRLINEVERI